MTMVNLIYSTPNLLLFIIIFFIMGCISVFFLCLTEKYISLESRYGANTPIGYIAATIGVIYAVLAGFIIFHVMNNFDKASDITEKEAMIVAKIFRNSERLPEAIRTKIKIAMQSYAKEVISTEWPLLVQDKLSPAGQIILDKLNHELNSYIPSDNRTVLTLQTLFVELDNLYSAREQRIDMSKAALTVDLWVLIIISTLLTLVVNCIFGMEFYLHTILQMSVALMISATLFLIIVLDRPFRGTFSVQPDTFREILLDMKGH
jgi:hypothetical protein